MKPGDLSILTAKPRKWLVFGLFGEFPIYPIKFPDSLKEFPIWNVYITKQGRKFPTLFVLFRV